MKFNKYIKSKKYLEEITPFSIRSGKIKNGKIESIYRSPWSEDVYISDSKEKVRIGKSFDFNSLPILSAILIFLIFILMLKISWLQIAQGAHYREMADGNRIRIQRIEPKRGIIYDQNHLALVRNKANFMLYIVPADLPKKREDVDKIFDRIGELITGVDLSKIREKINGIDMRLLESYNPIFITDNIEYEKALSLYLEASNWSGVIISSKKNRDYPVFVNKETDETYYSLSHILGYTGKINEKELEKFGEEYLQIDYIGKMGLEYFWENELKGRGGKKRIEVDALGKEKKILGQVDEADGNNLVLSLDINQQIKLEEILRDYLKKLKLTKAVAIVINPNNGEILAMVSLPSYNNNLFAHGISQDEYTELINNPDHPLFNRSISGDYPSGSTFKIIMSAAALEEEVKGEKWYIGDTYHLSIGQGDLLVTPLQVAMYTSVFANGGALYRPHFVKEILSSDDKLISETENIPTRKDFIKKYNIDIVRQGMRRAVTSGSAIRLSLLPFESAGKTGTAQWSSQKENHAWFTGFAPYDNPEVVITVLVEEGGEGSAVAVPIASDFLKWYFTEYKERVKISKE